MNILKVGETRPSQLLWNFGIGSVMDLRSLSVTVTSVDQWPTGLTVLEPRLLQVVRDVFGSEVEGLVAPPLRPDGKSFDPENKDGMAHIGVPVTLFPKYLRCPRCNLLASSDSGLFTLKKNTYRPELNRYEHQECPQVPRGRWPSSVSARHLVACDGGGHIDDFPWHYYVHSGVSSCRGTLKFEEKRGSSQAEDLSVSCSSCGAYKSMATAFGDKAEAQLPKCRGHHPHLGTFSECDKPLRTLLLGATNTWFPITRSVLSIPSEGGKLNDLVDKHRVQLERAQDLAGLDLIVGVLKDQDSRFAEIGLQDLWNCLKEEGTGSSTETAVEGDIKLPEWNTFTDRPLPLGNPDFLATPVSTPSVSPPFMDVLKLERLREVNALVGFTRVEAVDPLMELEPDAQGPISRQSIPKHVPAIEVRGEGIFLRFDSTALKQWSEKPEVIQRSKELYRGHIRWRESRRMENPADGFPGMIYILVHTFSHVLLRQLAMECGYGAASLRERIYTIPNEESASEEAGLLIYTAAPDSEGTLGGLVRLAEDDFLGPQIHEALFRSQICSTDPLCWEHDPIEDRTLHGATCHACTLVSETSCEMANRYLDRRLLVKTDEEPLGFFELGRA
jgi:hypothetical protein